MTEFVGEGGGSSTSNLCSISPSDLAGNVDNLVSRVLNLEKLVAQLLGADVSANQMSDITQNLGWVTGITYLGTEGWTQTGTGTLIPPAGWSGLASVIDGLSGTVVSGAGNNYIIFDIDRASQPADDYVDINAVTDQSGAPVTWSNGPGFATIYFKNSGLHYAGAKFSLLEDGAGPTDTQARMFQVSGDSPVEGVASVELISTDYSHVDIGGMFYVHPSGTSSHPRVGFAYGLCELVKISGTSGSFSLYNSYVQIVKLG